MPDTWRRALDLYRYFVDLARYEYAREFPNYFIRQIPGNRDSTRLFEDYFRDNMLHVEAWYEVVFWKMYSQANLRDDATRNRELALNRYSVTADQLRNALHTFVTGRNKLNHEGNFRNFCRLLHFANGGIDTAATFPAFACPERFPMVDTRVAKWVNSEKDAHNDIDRSGPQLIRTRYNIIKGHPPLTTADIDFYLHWIDWTRHTASKLNRHELRLGMEPKG